MELGAKGGGRRFIAGLATLAAVQPGKQVEADIFCCECLLNHLCSAPDKIQGRRPVFAGDGVGTAVGSIAHIAG